MNFIMIDGHNFMGGAFFTSFLCYNVLAKMIIRHVEASMS